MCYIKSKPKKKLTIKITIRCVLTEKTYKKWRLNVSIFVSEGIKFQYHYTEHVMICRCKKKKGQWTQTWIDCLGSAAEIQYQQVVKRLGNLHHEDNVYMKHNSGNRTHKSH